MIRTAYHEAGHCVVAQLFGWRVHQVSFFRPGLANTIVDPHGRPSKEDLCCFHLAGRMAELIKLGECEANFKDVTEALRLCNWDQAVVMREQSRAEKLLRENWPLVERIAAELLEAIPTPA